MTDKTPEEMIAEIHGVLFNMNGRKGLCQQVEDNTKAINKIWLAITAIVVAGGGGSFAIVRAILGG